MTLTEKYDQLLFQLQQIQAQTAHVSKAVGHLHQRLIDEAGVRVIEFEERHGIIEARHLLEHERFVLPQLSQNEAMLERYNAEPLKIDLATATGDEIELETAGRSLLLSEIKRAITTLSRMRDDIIVRRKKLGKEVLEIAGWKVPITEYERSVWTQIYNNTRAERASNSVFDKILKPLELATA